MSDDPPPFDYNHFSNAQHNQRYQNTQVYHLNGSNSADYSQRQTQTILNYDHRENSETPNSTTTEDSVTAALPEFLPTELFSAAAGSLKPKKEIIQLDDEGEEEEILDYTNIKPLNLKEEEYLTLAKISSVPRNVCPPECLVCGEPANGYHYGIASCNGCKTFFRRSVLGNRTYKCKGQGKCMQDTTKSRTYCKACRLTKCLDMGMSPLAMEKPPPTVNEFLKNKRIKVELDPDMPSTSKITPPLKPDDGSINALIDGLMYLELKTETFRSSAYNPWPYSIKGLYDSLTSESLISLGDRLGPMHGWPIKPHEPLVDNTNRKMWLAFDILTAVEWAKTFPFLHQLTPQDRMILLRSTALLLMDMSSSYFAYEQGSPSLTFPDGTGLFKHPRVPPPWVNHQLKQRRREMPKEMREHTRLILRENREAMTKMLSSGIGVLFRNDLEKQEYVLLKAILLTNSGVPDLSKFAQQLLADERRKYADALLRYCQGKYGTVEGASRYAAILSIVRTFEEMCKMQKDHHVLLTIFLPCHQKIQIIDEVMQET